NDSLVTQVHAVEGTDGKEERAIQLRQIGGGMEGFHQTSRIRETCGNGGASSCEPSSRNWRRRAPPSHACVLQHHSITPFRYAPLIRETCGSERTRAIISNGSAVLISSTEI